MKEGEAPFLEQARKVLRYGAAVVVMAFDEQGQADTAERKFAICERAYRLLIGTRSASRPRTSSSTPTSSRSRTGIEEHDNYAVDFIEATREIKRALPHAQVSGGVSNVSFASAATSRCAEAIHSVFLYHAIEAGHGHGHRQRRPAPRL